MVIWDIKVDWGMKIERGEQKTLRVIQRAKAIIEGSITGQMSKMTYTLSKKGVKRGGGGEEK